MKTADVREYTHSYMGKSQIIKSSGSSGDICSLAYLKQYFLDKNETWVTFHLIPSCVIKKTRAAVYMWPSGDAMSKPEEIRLRAVIWEMYVLHMLAVLLYLCTVTADLTEMMTQYPRCSAGCLNGLQQRDCSHPAWACIHWPEWKHESSHSSTLFFYAHRFL